MNFITGNKNFGGLVCRNSKERHLVVSYVAAVQDLLGYTSTNSATGVLHALYTRSHGIERGLCQTDDALAVQSVRRRRTTKSEWGSAENRVFHLVYLRRYLSKAFFETTKIIRNVCIN